MTEQDTHNDARFFELERKNGESTRIHIYSHYISPNKPFVMEVTIEKMKKELMEYIEECTPTEDELRCSILSNYLNHIPACLVIDEIDIMNIFGLTKCSRFPARINRACQERFFKGRTERETMKVLFPKTDEKGGMRRIPIIFIPEIITSYYNMPRRRSHLLFPSPIELAHKISASIAKSSMLSDLDRTYMNMLDLLIILLSRNPSQNSNTLFITFIDLSFF